MIIEVYLWISKDKLTAMLPDIVIEIILFLGFQNEKEQNNPADHFEAFPYGS